MPDPNFTEEIGQVWDLVKESLLEKFSETAVNLWFGEIEIIAFKDDVVTLGIPSEFKFNIVQEKYLNVIRDEFCKMLGFDVSVNLIFTGSATASSNPIKQEQSSDQDKDLPKLNDAMPEYRFEYTFDNFIVGTTNKFAQAACVAVANHPAENYNPLFIYGNSGLGKTHLMYATINQMKKNNPRIKVIYTKGEDFTNQMITCLANKTMEDFRDKFRKCDVLLIDDIQFIAGKVATQEEFFHTFNALFEEKKQIILTSDRPPREIKTLEDRLKSRFEWGLIADIEPPDLELRIAIIKKKAEQVNIHIPDDVLNYMAENLRSNIRQIEGTIKKLGAFSFLSNKVITMDLAKECIAELLGGPEPASVTVDKIFAVVSKKYGISREMMVGKKRNREIAMARHVSVFLIRDMTDMSFPNIAKIFARDHATIMSSYNFVVTKYQNDEDFAKEVNEMKSDILEK